MLKCLLATAIAASLAPLAVTAQMASAELINTAGAPIGTATLTQGPNGVLVHVKVTGLEPGKHGLHLHSHGVCATEDGFKSAAGHVGLKEGGHGLMNPEGPEPGDLPNLFVAADGSGQMEAFSDMLSLEGGANGLLDADGSSFIIHENGDDHLSQPIGGAGARVACGILTMK